uniref:Uncharacterized protein n=1 Tax=Haematobia irritans TaxID=7368 RepID=A0A1L8E5V3_HAEIR
MEHFKQRSSFGDEPDLVKKAQGRNSLHYINGTAAAYGTAPSSSIAPINALTDKINLDTSSLNDCERGYVPTVGRWGAEWPS